MTVLNLTPFSLLLVVRTEQRVPDLTEQISCPWIVAVLSLRIVEVTLSCDPAHGNTQVLCSSLLSVRTLVDRPQMTGPLGSVVGRIHRIVARIVLV